MFSKITLGLQSPKLKKNFYHLLNKIKSHLAPPVMLPRTPQGCEHPYLGTPVLEFRSLGNPGLDEHKFKIQNVTLLLAYFIIMQNYTKEKIQV